MVGSACKRLMAARQGCNNFHNETPFAERLVELTDHTAVPDSTKEEFAETVVTCSVGNRWRTSNAADVSYTTMIRSFSPREVDLLFQLMCKKNIFMTKLNDKRRKPLLWKTDVAFILDGEAFRVLVARELEGRPGVALIEGQVKRRSGR